MVWTDYAGIEVIESHEAPVGHPRWGGKKVVPLVDATLLLLADGTALVVCDHPGCGYNGITGLEPYVKPEGQQKEILDQSYSVRSHANSTHRLTKEKRPLYSDEQIKVAIKIYLKWKATHIKNWGEQAARELDSLGFKPYRSERWTSSLVGGLARAYMDKPEFKNIKAGPLTVEDHEALAGMIRDAANRVAAKGGSSTVAGEARITEKKPPHVHTPVDFAAIIAANEAKKKQEEEVQLPPTVSSVPVLTFEPISDKEKVQVPVPASPKPVPRPAPRQAKASPAESVPVVAVVTSDYIHAVELPDGTPVFHYKGVLMAGKPVKGVEI